MFAETSTSNVLGPSAAPSNTTPRSPINCLLIDTLDHCLAAITQHSAPKDCGHIGTGVLGRAGSRVKTSDIHE